MLLLSTFLVGLFATRGSSQPVSEEKDVTPNAEVSVTVVDDKLPLQYGPEYGVKYSEIHSHPKNFDDTEYLYTAPSSNVYRRISEIQCYHNNPGNHFVGLLTVYSDPSGDDQAESSYHGYKKGGVIYPSYNSYKLAKDEYFTRVTYRYCGRNIDGIHFDTSRGTKGVSCGYYDYNNKAGGCGGGVLVPPTGRKIVGLYGDANGEVATSAQGVRGIGLITL